MKQPRHFWWVASQALPLIHGQLCYTRKNDLKRKFKACDPEQTGCVEPNGNNTINEKRVSQNPGQLTAVTDVAV